MRSVGLITMHKYMVTSQQSLIREDGEMHITLQKREKGKTWSSPIQGQGSLDPYAADQEQNGLFCKGFKKSEVTFSGDVWNPGFDFSQAQFTGTCPDPRTFMGGIRSD